MAAVVVKKLALYEYRRRLEGCKERTGCILELVDAKQQRAWGEISPLPGLSRESVEQAKRELFTRIFPLFMRPAVSLDLLRTALKRCSFSVQFGVESAVLDLIDPRPDKAVPLCGLARGSMEAIGKRVARRDVSTMKIKLSPFSIEEARRLIEWLAPHVTQTKLRIDMNQSWSLRDAQDFAYFLPKGLVAYYEEPTKELAHLATFCAPFALDETARKVSLHSLPSLPKWRALVVKPTLSGGFSALQPMVRFCAEKGIDFIVSSSYESEIGIAQIAKLCHRLHLPLQPMGLDTCRYFLRPLTSTPLVVQKGLLIPRSTWHIEEESINGCIRMSF